MADNKLDNEFQNIAKSMADISKSTGDIRIKIRQDLIDSVKELSDITREYNQDLKDQETSWGKLLASTKDYSKEVQQANKTAREAEQRKVDLTKKLNELENKRFDYLDGNLTLTVRENRELRDKIRASKEQIANLDQTVTKAKALAQALKDGSNNSKTLGQNIKKFFSDNIGKFIEALSFKELIKFLGESNKQTVELAKTIGGSIDDAADLKFQFTQIAANIDQASISTKNLTESYFQLSKATQATAGFTADQLIAQTELTKLVGLQGEEAASLIKLGILNSKTNEDITGEILDQVVALEKETGIRLDGREILREVAKINGQLAAQYQFNNKLLAEAVVKVKQFGLNLRDAEGIANNLLEFEQSISNELSAELLTGKNLNLERARLLALEGDTAAAAAEVAKQFGSAEEFTNMTVLQQRELAKAVGLTANQLSDSIKEREVLSSLGAKNIEQLEKEGRLQDLLKVKNGEELYQQYMQQSAQEKFNESIIKLKGLVTSVVEAFTPIISIITTVLDNSYIMNAVLGAIAAVQIPKILAGYSAMIFRSKALLRLARMRGVANIFSGSFLGGPLGLVLAGAAVAAMATAIAKASKADDMYGDMTLVTKKPFGAIALNNKDQFAAGPGVADALNGGGGGGGGMSRGDLDYLINGINDKKVQFDSFASSGPQALVNTERRRPTNLFF